MKEAGCLGKTPYVSPQRAHRTLRHRCARKRMGAKANNAHVYRCEHCGLWHIGHRDPIDP